MKPNIILLYFKEQSLEGHRQNKIASYFWSISFHLFLLLSNSRSYMNIFSTSFYFNCPDRVFAKQQLIPSQTMYLNKSAQITFVNLQLHYINTYKNLKVSVTAAHRGTCTHLQLHRVAVDSVLLYISMNSSS